MNLTILRISLACCFLSCLAISSAVTGNAAPPNGFNGQAAANEITDFKGELKGVRGSIVTITRDDGVDVMVQFPDNPASLNYVAKALPAYLRRGMPVRFRTTLGPAGTPISPVDKVEIFAPVPTQAIHGRAKELFTPGVHSESHARQPKNTPMTGKVTVVGSLVMLTPQGGLAVQAGKYPVQTMVSPNATLEIRINNLSLAKTGDPVSVSGFYQPPDDTKVKADRITITSDTVYGATPPPQPKRSRRARSSKEDTTASKEDTTAEETPDEEADKPAIEEDEAMQKEEA